ncbi:MAG: HEPN domain-containing protein [Betaproteobacteria bacterium]|nr:HEPN domain-containing protein [Betaproteobacteria bacterium]
MPDADRIRRMLLAAQRDRDALVAMGDSLLVADAIYGFHVQQSIEKVLKAWLLACGREYPFTHDLGRLIGLLEDAGEDVMPFLNLVRFTIFAVQARYEGVLDSEPALDRADALRKVDALVACVRQIAHARQT